MDAIYGEVTDIDRRTCKRTVPMRVICAGLSRTGTSSLRAALKRLGYEDTYHMASAARENIRDCEMWMDAIRAKYDGNGSFEKEDWDKLLGHCQAVTDSPPANFIPELVKAYPEAKVVLNTRDIDSWYTSALTTIDISVAQGDNLKGVEDPEMRRLRLIRQEMMDRLWETKFPRGFKEHGKKSFIEHHDMVRRLVPKENLLEYSVKEGWEPLCKFLGEPVPDEPFPCLNDRASFWTGMVKAFGYEFTQPS